MSHARRHLPQRGKLLGAKHALAYAQQFHFLAVNHLHNKPRHQADHPYKGELQGKIPLPYEIKGCLPEPDRKNEKTGNQYAHQDRLSRTAKKREPS